MPFEAANPSISSGYLPRADGSEPMKPTIAILLLLGVFVMAGRHVLFDKPLLRLCEEALRSSLQTPASYRRIGTSVTTEKLSAGEQSPLLAELNRLGANASGAEIERTIVVIGYRAANQASAPTRRLAQCEVLTVRDGRGDLLDRWLLLEGERPATDEMAKSPPDRLSVRLPIDSASIRG